MAYCETCGKEFKTGQGLAGHRWPTSGRQRYPERPMSPRPGAQQLEQLPQFVREAMQAQSASAHDHATCHACKELDQAAMKKVVNHYESIAGVTELRKEHEFMNSTFIIDDQDGSFEKWFNGLSLK